jgi:hypothetical protein
MKPYLSLVTGVGRKKACWWNGDIAPYGFEGLILNLGNGLVKAGQIDAARVIYANAKYADNYEGWPYRNVLEPRCEPSERTAAARSQPQLRLLPRDGSGTRAALTECQSLEKEKANESEVLGLESCSNPVRQAFGGPECRAHNASARGQCPAVRRR